MNNLLVWCKTASLISALLLNTACSPSNAESPCPPTIKSASITVIDSISDDIISTADVYLSGQFYDADQDDLADIEIRLDYDPDYLSYRMFTDLNIEHDGLTIYTLDDDYHYNVSKPLIFDCTSLELEVHVCPNGTACR